MTTYNTKYSSLSDLSKRERKIKANQFPFIVPNPNLSSIEWIGQKVKIEPGNNVKFCPMCDTPMIARISISPCEHVLCYTCSLPYISTAEKWCPM